MDINSLTTQKIDWDSMPQGELNGKTGSSLYKEIITDGLRVMLAEYSAGYESAEWCDKAHIIHCASGVITLHFKSRSDIKLSAGDSILLAPSDSHTATTGNTSAVIFVVDKG